MRSWAEFRVPAALEDCDPSPLIEIAGELELEVAKIESDEQTRH